MTPRMGTRMEMVRICCGAKTGVVELEGGSTGAVGAVTGAVDGVTGATGAVTGAVAGGSTGGVTGAATGGSTGACANTVAESTESARSKTAMCFKMAIVYSSEEVCG